MTQTENLPLVSIITPVYNGSKYIEELIRSVRSQDYPNIEHIIIDDGSRDGGATVAILKRHPHLRWWSRENRGQYATMNEGLEAARGEIVCFISSDDRMMPGAIRLVIEFLTSHHQYDGVYGLTRYMDANGGDYPIPIPFRKAPFAFYPYFSHIEHCSLYICRNSLIANRLFFDATIKYVGDYDWILRIQGTRLRLGRINRPLSEIRIHTLQATQLYQRTIVVEKKKILVGNHVNPMLYFVFTVIYVLVHDAWKLAYTIKRSGLQGGYQLIRNKCFKKEKNEF